jgi:uncharacterized protein DUF6644
MPPSINHWLNQFCAWVDQTPLSQIIQTKAWIVPTVQSVHILAISVVMASVLMIDLRLLGVVGRDQSIGRVAARFLPFIWWPLLVLLATGAVMIIGEPARSLKNNIFQLKVALIVAAMIVTFAFQMALRKRPAFAAGAGGRDAIAIAVVSLVLWVGIVCAGRWIAYS